MYRVDIQGWNTGFQKIALNHLLRESLGISLGEAKALVDKILSGEPISLSLSTREVAEIFCKSAANIGVASVTIRDEDVH